MTLERRNESSAAAAPLERKVVAKAINMTWFHGKISREVAEKILTPRTDGLFLVRESTNFPGDFTLCVCFENRVEHYRIILKDEKITIDEEEYFETLTSLIQHYQVYLSILSLIVYFLENDLWTAPAPPPLVSKMYKQIL